MTGITIIKGTVLPFEQDNVDTDQILPKQFLTRVTKTGYGAFLFNDLRYIEGDKQRINPKFVLNDVRYRGANILIAGHNFGCGSSREHAPWAIADYGFKAIIAPSFADIFYTNCINNQILPVTLDSNVVSQLFLEVSMDANIHFEIDLPNQRVRAGKEAFQFEIEQNYKNALLSGLDKIDAALAVADKIEHYQQKIPAWRR